MLGEFSIQKRQEAQLYSRLKSGRIGVWYCCVESLALLVRRWTSRNLPLYSGGKSVDRIMGVLAFGSFLIYPCQSKSY